MFLSGALFVLFLAGYWLFCLTDAATTPAAAFHGLSKRTWVAVIALTFIVGAAAWHLTQRRARRRARRWPQNLASHVTLGQYDGADWYQTRPLTAAEALARHPASQIISPAGSWAGAIALHGSRPAPEQGNRAAAVSAPGMGQADRDLSQALPEIALVIWAGLPHRLEYLVGVERPALVNEALREQDRFARFQAQIIGHRRLAGRVLVQGPAEAVPRPGVLRSACGIPIAVRARSAARGVVGAAISGGGLHRSGSGSSSHDRSSRSNLSGTSSCGKWPAPSMSRHRYGAST